MRRQVILEDDQIDVLLAALKSQLRETSWYLNTINRNVGATTDGAVAIQARIDRWSLIVAELEFSKKREAMP